MTDPEIRLKILEILTPTCSRNDITKFDVVAAGGPADKYFAFVKGHPVEAKQEHPK